jgi:hypothetical protein
VVTDVSGEPDASIHNTISQTLLWLNGYAAEIYACLSFSIPHTRNIFSVLQTFFLNLLYKSRPSDELHNAVQHILPCIFAPNANYDVKNRFVIVLSGEDRNVVSWTSGN